MLMGFEINGQDKKTLINTLFSSENHLHIVSGNPEVLFNGMNNEILNDDFKRDDTIIIPDGIGVVLGMKWRGYSIEKLAGIELAEEILLECEKRGKSVFFLGGTEKVNETTKNVVQEKHPKLVIKGAIDGFYYNERRVVEIIKEASPDVLLVAMGCPRQETFIINYRDELNIPIMMGVGGTFDVWSNNVRRAPQWMINCRLEWLYRLLKEPKRIGRYKTILSFMLLSKKTAKEERK